MTDLSLVITGCASLGALVGGGYAGYRVLMRRNNNSSPKFCQAHESLVKQLEEIPPLRSDVAEIKGMVKLIVKDAHIIWKN